MTIKLNALSAAQRTALARVAPPSADHRIPGRMEVRAAGDDTVELLIYGNIGDSWWDESVTAKQVVEQLRDSAANRILVRINSYGGSVTDGIAIYNELRSQARKGVQVDGQVDGIAASIASLIGMACDTLTMPETTRLMLHAPWGYFGFAGNVKELREAAAEFEDVLTGYGKAMALAYARKSGKPATDYEAMWADGKDNYYSAAEAVEAGLADAVAENADADDEDADANAMASAVATADAQLQRLIARAPQGAIPALFAAVRPPETQRQATSVARTRSSAAADAVPPAVAGSHEEIEMPNPTDPKAADVSAAHRQAADDAVAALRTRNGEIRALAEPHFDNPEVRAYYDEVIAAADPSVTADDASRKILKLLGKGRESLGGDAHVSAGADERDKTRAAATQIILARAGVLSGDEDNKARAGNPFNGLPLMEIARACAQAAGVNTRGMDTERVFMAAVTQTTSDFPVIFENALHKMLITQFLAGEQAWRRFCKIGTLSDFRPHIRIFGSTFADLDTVNEAGEYKDGTFPDGEKQTIAARSKGRILNLSYEAIKNDDVGFFADAAQGMGAAAIRTLNKDVFALLALNGGAGPTMADGKALFHVDHGNIASVAAVPTVTSVDAARQQMAKQKAPGGNDYLDLRPDVWLGPLSLSGAARVVNGDTYDPDAANKLQRTNIAKGTYSDIVDSPRVADGAWYSLANPNLAPVFEVGFVDGIQVPRLVMQEAFRSNGVSWRVSYDYGVAAVGFRGAVKTPTT